MYHDLLIRIKNAQAARHRTVSAPYSKFNFAIAKFLVDAGYVKGVEKKTANKNSSLEITLAYHNGSPTINGLAFVSTPSRHLYVGANKVRRVKQGYGVGVISTSRGVMSDKEAKGAKVGGEYLFQIW